MRQYHGLFRAVLMDIAVGVAAKWRYAVAFDQAISVRYAPELAAYQRSTGDCVCTAFEPGETYQVWSERWRTGLSCPFICHLHFLQKCWQCRTCVLDGLCKACAVRCHEALGHTVASQPSAKFRCACALDDTTRLWEQCNAAEATRRQSASERKRRAAAHRGALALRQEICTAVPERCVGLQPVRQAVWMCLTCSLRWDNLRPVCATSPSTTGEDRIHVSEPALQVQFITTSRKSFHCVRPISGVGYAGAVLHVLLAKLPQSALRAPLYRPRDGHLAVPMYLPARQDCLRVRAPVVNVIEDIGCASLFRVKPTLTRPIFYGLPVWV